MMADTDEWGDLKGDTYDSDTSDSEAPVPGAPEEEAPAQPLEPIFEGIHETTFVTETAQGAPDSWDMWMGKPEVEGAPVPGASQVAPAASSTDAGPHALWLLPPPKVDYQ